MSQREKKGIDPPRLPRATRSTLAARRAPAPPQCTRRPPFAAPHEGLCRPAVAPPWSSSRPRRRPPLLRALASRPPLLRTPALALPASSLPGAGRSEARPRRTAPQLRGGRRGEGRCGRGGAAGEGGVELKELCGKLTRFRGLRVDFS
ncbi:hypothetical protein PVAP13_9NG839912 [Panicum virgatum]|uniref:Uncharacterized protein n=1 Tax=Panicum virgatum TaxID=38727 RepID=A0A8T0MYU3_PANVG|nr:hypothetical protein PVAP13_9NG839912 [Panicum virgatum]